MKDDMLYLIHISESISKINLYVENIDREKFLSHTLTQDAVLRNLQILAESTQRLSESFKKKFPNIEWYKIAGLRNILVHDSLGIDLDIVWDVIKLKLPELGKIVAAQIPQNG